MSISYKITLVIQKFTLILFPKIAESKPNKLFLLFCLIDIRRKWVFIIGLDRLLLLYLFKLKFCAMFVPYTFKPHEIEFSIQETLLKRQKRPETSCSWRRNVALSIRTRNQAPKYEMRAARGAEAKKTREEKSKIKSMLICFYYSKGIYIYS